MDLGEERIPQISFWPGRWNPRLELGDWEG